MKIFKFMLTAFILLSAAINVKALENDNDTTRYFAVIWPTHYRIFVSDIIPIYYEIQYQEVYLSSTSTYATDTCEGWWNY